MPWLYKLGIRMDIFMRSLGYHLRAENPLSITMNCDVNPVVLYTGSDKMCLFNKHRLVSKVFCFEV